MNRGFERKQPGAWLLVAREKESQMLESRKLFTPISVGAIELGHRVVMAPLTRMRSTIPGDVPNESHA